LDDRFAQRIFVGLLDRSVAQRGSALIDQPARVSFAHPMLLVRVLDCGPTPLRA
jgi:hypothetical protein